MIERAMNDGRRIPAIGFGTYKVPADDAERLCRAAIDAGYGMIDTAALYGNEEGVGAATAGTELFVTTKLWRDSMGADAALAAFDASLARLGRESVDLYLIHWPMPNEGRYVETWRALVRLRDEGRARSIGVSNFSPEHLDRIVDATGVVPALNQIELHPTFQQRAAREAHERLGIVTQSWAPLGQGRLLEHPVIAGIAARLERSAAQVILAWHLAHGLAVIPKASAPERIRQNLAAAEVSLSDADMAAIDALDDPAGRMGPDPETF